MGKPFAVGAATFVGLCVTSAAAFMLVNPNGLATPMRESLSSFFIPTDAAASVQRADLLYYLQASGTYHTTQCGDVKDYMAQYGTIGQGTAADLVEVGYKPCSICQPNTKNAALEFVQKEKTTFEARDEFGNEVIVTHERENNLTADAATAQHLINATTASPVTAPLDVLPVEPAYTGPPDDRDAPYRQRARKEQERKDAAQRALSNQFKAKPYTPPVLDPYTGRGVEHFNRTHSTPVRLDPTTGEGFRVPVN